MFRYKNLNKSTQKDKFAPDIDGNDAADLTAEETLHTFKSLLCRNKLNHSYQYCNYKKKINFTLHVKDTCQRGKGTLSNALFLYIKVIS